MRTTRPRRPAGRAAFTLIELMVVVGLILLLAVLAVMFAPGALDSERAAQGASRLQGWLTTAKQRAVLDRAPRGVRLLLPPTTTAPPNNYYVTQVQYIEQPEDFISSVVNGVPGTVTTSVNSSGQQTATFSPQVDLTGGSTNPGLYPVQAGDYIEFLRSGLVHQITNVSPPTITLFSTLPQQITTATDQFRIIRAPRVLGEEPQEMPTNIAIDLNQTLSGQFAVPMPPVNGNNNAIDILFGPTGAVLTNTGSDRIILWVRDVTQNTAFDGNPTLIVVYLRSGLIAAYPVNTNPGQTSNGLPYPYFFVP
jgi:prepilin-type N-terminal cleavage/methylation domain-containing protein